MFTVAKRGRNPQFDEPMVPRHFELPESINDALVSESKRLGKDQVRIVREALSVRFGLGEPTPDTEQTSEQTSLRELKDLLQQAISDSLRLKLSARDRADLLLMARRMGYEDAEDLVEDLAKRALDAPKEAEEFIRRRVRAEVAKQRKAEEEGRGDNETRRAA